MKNYSNNLDCIEALVREVISSPGENDYIKFEIRDLEIISETKEYHGTRINLTGNITHVETVVKLQLKKH